MVNTDFLHLMVDDLQRGRRPYEDGDLAQHVSPGVFQRYAASEALADDPIGSPSFAARWVRTIVPEVGPMPYWATNSGATAVPSIIDSRGMLQYCRVNEARFWGARRVENLLRASNDLDNSTYWTAVGTATVSEVTTDASVLGELIERAYLITGNGTSNCIRQTLSLNGAGGASGVLRATKHTFSIWLRSGSVSSAVIQLYVSGGAAAANATVTLTSTWQRFAITGTPDGSSTYTVLVTPASSGTIYARNAQVEDLGPEAADGSGNVPPSEYVSRDDIVYTSQAIAVYHGAMVDGVRYFDTARANALNNTTKLVTEATGAAIADSTLWGLMVEPQIVNLVTNSDTLSGWTVNATSSVTIATNAATSPDGRQNAAKITEDSASTSKFAYFAMAASDSAKCCAQVIAKKGTSGGRDHLRLGIKKKDATTVTCFFNLGTGALGTVGSGAESYITPLSDGWYLCAMVVDVGTGGGTPEMHVGLSSADGTTTYSGNGAGNIFVWRAQFHAKEHPATPIQTAGSTATRTGHALAIPNQSVIGRNNLAVYMEAHPLYRTGIGNKTSDGTTQEWYYMWYGRARPFDQAYHRIGQTLRPFSDSVLGYAIWALDRYLGNPTPALKWQASTAYALGDFVVPTDTQANNANSRKLYTCTQAGTSGGSEPTWNTSGFPTVEQSDGTCKWQCNHDNRLNGSYEPYDGTLVLVQGQAFERLKMASWAMDTPTLGACINGVTGYRQTDPFPADQSEKGDLLRDIDEIRFGRASGTYAQSSQAFRRVKIYDRRVNVGALSRMTA